VTVKVKRANGETLDIVARCRIDTYNELEYYRSGGILQYVLRKLAA
jgi:aconitate hydratase